MGKVWPRDSVAFNQATTVLSTITTLDESPLLADLIYVGTFDGVVQVTEDGTNVNKPVKIPVVDGTLKEYQKYLPAGSTPTGTPTPSETARIVTPATSSRTPM